MPKKIAAVLAIPILLLISLILSNLGKGEQPLPFFLESRNIFKPTPAPDILSPLIEKEIAGLSGRWAIAVKDLKTNQTYGANLSEIFDSASLYKLSVMWATYDAIEKGQLKADQILAGQKSALDQTAAGIGNHNQEQNDVEEETISYPVHEALRLMITISDNYSAILLGEKLGWTNIDQLMEKEGLSSFDLASGSPKTTAIATLNLLDRIYTNTAVSTKYSEEMKTLLFAQTSNDRIPKYLPADIKVGHKTGELNQVRHDAGIILGKNSDYIFVFLSETANPAEASETIATLSKKLFDALEQQ